MAKTWIKFYTEALHDRKMRKLNRFDKSVFYDLLLLAGQEDDDGRLPDIDDIALELDLKRAEAEKSVRNLVGIGVITITDDNGLMITQFQKRQESNLTGYERVKRYRDNKRNVINDNADDNAMITRGNSNGNANDNKHNVISGNANDTKMITVEEEVEEEEEVEVEEEERVNTRAKKTVQKHKHGNFKKVLLTDEELTKLHERFIDADRRIQNLDDYLENNPSKHYANHYLTILKWAEKDAERKAAAPVQPRRESWVELAERLSKEAEVQA